MGWNVIDHKMSGIRSSLNDWELKTLEWEFVEVTSRMTRVTRCARSLRGVLFIDLAYAVAKHRDWLQTPVFSALLVEFLQLDHGLPRVDAEILVHDMIEAAIEVGLSRSRTICGDDREFLTWAYICAAGASGEEALEAELGLGTAVLNKLREGIKALERVDSDVFVPEYDAMLAAIVIELGHETKSAPWAMDHHRLRYALLAAAGDAAQPYILEEALPLIFDALIAIGLGEAAAFRDRPSLAEMLVDASILCVAQPKRKGKTTGHQLTDLGARITAHKVAVEIFAGGLDDRFKSLNNRWQEAVVKRSEGLTFDSLAVAVSNYVNQLSPEVVEAAVARMLNIDAGRVTGDVVRSLLANTHMAWHKAAVMRALRTGKPSRDLLDAIAGELSTSVAPGVRLAAGALLDAWTE